MNAYLATNVRIQGADLDVHTRSTSRFDTAGHHGRACSPHDPLPLTRLALAVIILWFSTTEWQNRYTRPI